MRSAAAYAPGHVTGFFEISDSASDPLEKGSLGAGFSVEAGVTTRVCLCEISPSDPLAAPGNQILRTRISINGSHREDAVVSQEVVREFFSRLERAAHSEPPRTLDRAALLSVEHHVEVPEASGFGSSGAAALSLSYALNALFDRPFRLVECAQIAHLAEIACGTGLGTVIGEYGGGCEIRTLPGAPGIGRTEGFDPKEKNAALFVVFGALSTRSMLSDASTRNRINAAGKRCVNLLLENPSVEEFLRLSREFAEGSGLISMRVRELLDLFDANAIPASMLMFGEGVFTIMRRDGVPKARRLVDTRAQNGDLLVSSIDSRGGRIIDED